MISLPSKEKICRRFWPSGCYESVTRRSNSQTDIAAFCLLPSCDIAPATTTLGQHIDDNERVHAKSESKSTKHFSMNYPNEYSITG